MLSLSVLKFHTGRNSLQQGGWPSVPRGPWAPPHHSRCPPQTSAMFWTGDTTTATPHTSGPRPPLPHPLQIQDHINVNTSHDICHCCPIFIRGGCDLQYREELVTSSQIICALNLHIASNIISCLVSIISSYLYCPSYLKIFVSF